MTAKKKKWSRILLYYLAFILLFCIALHLSFVLYFNDRIRDRFQKEFAIQTDGEYVLKLDKLKINIFRQSVLLMGLKVTPVKGKEPDASKYSISAASIKLEDFHLIDFISIKVLRFKQLQLQNPSVTVFRNNVDTSENPTPKKTKFSLYALLKPYCNVLNIKEIRIRDAEFKVYNNDKDSLLLINSKENELAIDGLVIDETAQRAGRLFMAKKTELVINKFAFTTKDSLYTIRIARLSASYTDSSVIMDSLQLIPNHSKSQFGKVAGKQTDRLQIDARKLEFNRMDVKLFFEKNWFIARQMKISNLNLNAYRDKNVTRIPNEPVSVQALIKKIPVYIKIDSMVIKNATCVYEEVREGTNEPGRISFNDINGVITGLANRHGRINDKKALTVKASCKLMDHSKIDVIYSFPYNTEGMVFDCSGRLYRMPFKEMNDILEPIAKVSIKEGEVDSMSFFFHAGDVSSEGWMKLAYHGLKVDILKDARDGENKERRFFSFLANNFIIKEDNPTRNQPLRVTRIHYTRNRERFMFNYSLKSLLSGMKTAIGLPDKN